MPKPTHIQVQHRGLFTGADNWSTGHALKATYDGGAGPGGYEAALADLAQKLNTRFATAWTAMATLMSAETSLVATRCTLFLAATQKNEYAGEYVRPVALVGQGTATLPPQISTVVSLRTAGIGPSARGRMYLPAVGIDLNGFRIAPADVTTMVGAMKAYFDNMGSVSVISPLLDLDYPGVASSVGQDAVKQYTGLQIGNVLDTQRRRRDQMTETRVSAVIV